jgi:small subunit ribosomal protein S2
VHQRINRLKELDEIDFDDVAGSSRTKKELLQMRRERDKLNKSLGGIREMSRPPAAVWIVDTNKEHLAVEEARKLRIPIIGILDSNCDPDLVDFPIPGNDDAIRAVGLLTRVIADAVAEGLIARSGAKTADGGTATPGAEEPLAEWERELLGGDADKAAVAATGDDTATDAPAAEATGASTEAPAADAAAEAATDEPAAAEAPAEAATDEPASAEVPAEAEVDEKVEDKADEKAEATTDEASAEGEFGADSAAPLESGEAPEGFEIKGNKTSKKFHAPSSPWYDRTNAEVWFRTAEAAEQAGFVNAEAKADEKADEKAEA